jgi:hypothetical protein
MALPPLELFSLERAALLPGGLFVYVRSGREAFSGSPMGPVFTRGDSLDTIRKGRGRADVAQLVEQLIRNQQGIGSSPIVGSSHISESDLRSANHCRSYSARKISAGSVFAARNDGI